MPRRGIRVALAGGGTGGHLFPGLALSRSLAGADTRPILYGSGRAAEADWVGEDAVRIALDAPLLPRRGTEIPGYLVRMTRAVRTSLLDIRGRRPDLVVGLGGFASVGPGIAALLSGRPLLLLEQNAVSGRANRLLSRLGGFLAATWPESLLDLPRYARTRARVVGNPVRAELRGGRRDPAAFGLDPDRPVLLVTGGSQGARGLNDRVCAAAPLFARHRVGVIHLCGAGEEARVGRAWRDAGATACVRAFTREMGDVYASADLVLARAGGTTVAELAFLGKPSVLVPYPHHADRHQERNARVLESVGAARVVPESELTPERAEREILGALLDGGELGRMGAAAARLGVPDAAERAASFAREVLWRAARGPGRSRAREKGREAVVDDLG